MSPVRPSRGPSDILFVEDIRFYGHHGATAAEQEVGAWYSVDVELALDLTPAALSDDLEATVDYGHVVRLLERLAGLLTEALLREYPAREVTIRVRKVTPPLGVAAVPGVQMKRSR